MSEEKIIDGLNTNLEKLTHRIQELIVENHKTQEGLKEKNRRAYTSQEHSRGGIDLRLLRPEDGKRQIQFHFT
jgi:hypothetical protein